MSWANEISDPIRHDLRHLMAHGHCRYELSQRLYDAYRAAHAGMAPEDVAYVVEKLPKKGPHIFDRGEKVGGEMFELMEWLDTLELAAWRSLAGE